MIKHHIKVRADKNIQFRLMNTLIKERLFAQGTMITESPQQLEIQYHCHVLYMTVIRKSSFQRFEFTQDIIYQCGNHKNSIMSVEQLIDILRDSFSIKISTKLSKEFIHSRDCLIESYKHFEHRHDVITQSMTFARLPEALNFFTWLQHLADNGVTQDLMYSESLVTEGLTLHPLEKMKLPMSIEAVKKYTAEFEKTIYLPIMLVHQDKIKTATINNDSQFILNQVIPQYRSKLKRYIEPLGLKLDRYRVMIVHPWQYKHVIAKFFESWVSENWLLPTPLTIEAKATESFKTLDLIHQPYQVEVSVDVRDIHSIRRDCFITMEDAPKITQILQHIFKDDSDLEVTCKPFVSHVKADIEHSSQLACSVNQKPAIFEPGSTIVSSSLVNTNPVDQHTVIDSYLEWLGNGVTQESVIHLISSYSDTLLTPLINVIQDYGVALDASMQNIIVHLGNDYQMKFIFRDINGISIHMPSLCQQFSDLRLTHHDIYSASIEEVVANLQRTVIQYHLAELVHHFTQYEGITEHGLYGIVQQVIYTAIDDTRPHADILKKVFFGAKVKDHSSFQQYLYPELVREKCIEFDNPLESEV